MDSCSRIFFTCLIFYGMIISSEEAAIQNKNEYIIDLTALGEEIYGLPDPKSGDIVKQHTGRTFVPEEKGTYHQGDIRFANPTPKSGFKSTAYRWPNGIIPYIIYGAFNYFDRLLIQDAIDEFHRNSCVRFVPRTNQSVFIRITSGYAGCYSSMGYIGQSYDVNLQIPGCMLKQTIMHELMHAMGFIHEQSRPDRDNYITILWRNIDRMQLSNFMKFPENVIDNFGVPYNDQSIMHYSGKAFSGNGRDTIVSKFGHRLAERKKLTQLDILKMNRMYLCQKPESLVRLQNFYNSYMG